MNLHANAALSWSGRRRRCELVVVEGWTVVAAAAAGSVSVRCARKWVGRYRLDTIVPGLYPGRTKHIHVKVQRPGGAVLTTQLFFPGVSANTGDGLFESDLLVQRWRRASGRRTARFDFVLAA